MTTYHLEILTPLGKVFAEEVDHTLVPAQDGFVGVLANHRAFLTSSAGGRLEARLASGDTRKFKVGPGFFQIAKNDACFLAESVTTQKGDRSLDD